MNDQNEIKPVEYDNWYMIKEVLKSLFFSLALLLMMYYVFSIFFFMPGLENPNSGYASGFNAFACSAIISLVYFSYSLYKKF